MDQFSARRPTARRYVWAAEVEDCKMGEVSNEAKGLARKKEEAGCESYNETAGEGPERKSQNKARATAQAGRCFVEVK